MHPASSVQHARNMQRTQHARQEPEVLSKFYGNRALCNADGLGRLDEALADCHKSIEANTKYAPDLRLLTL